MKSGYLRLVGKVVVAIVAAIFVATAVASAAAVYEYYPSGRVKSITYTPPEGGVSYVEYLDEDWDCIGWGRVYRKVSSTPDGDGAISYVYSDYADIYSCLSIEKFRGERQ